MQDILKGLNDKQYEAVTNNSILKIMIITIFSNGLIEAIISAIICPIVSLRLIKFINGAYKN